MSQTGTPTEFLQLGITEPDDTLNVLVDLNGQWQKIDTGVKNVDTKANTNASGITALNTAVQDNTENITNILETNVNQQNSIDTLQSKVATLEQDDTDYGTRITAVEAGVQENSELINDLEVDLSGVKTEIGTVPSGSTLQGQVDGLDTRVTTLENSGSVSALETRVGALETEVGTVPSGTTVQGQITTLNGQVNSGNIPFRFSVDGGGNYGYLKADDSFVPFSSGDGHWHELDTSLYETQISDKISSYIVPYVGYNTQSSDNYRKYHDLIHNTDYLVSESDCHCLIGNIMLLQNGSKYLLKNGTLTSITDNVVGIIMDNNTRYTYYLTRSGNTLQFNIVDANGDSVGLPVSYTLHGTPVGPIVFNTDYLIYKYNNTLYKVTLNSENGTTNETTNSSASSVSKTNKIGNLNNLLSTYYYIRKDSNNEYTDIEDTVLFDCNLNDPFFTKINGVYYYYI